MDVEKILSLTTKRNFLPLRGSLNWAAKNHT